jgi:hypothetical protein
MTTKSSTPSSLPPAPPTEPADGSVEALAAFLVAILDWFESHIPGFQPHDAADIHRIATAARYGNDLIPPTIIAVTAFAPAAEKNLFDSERGKAVLLFQEAMLPVVKRLMTLHDGLLFTSDSQVAEAGTEALQAYAWLKVYAKGPDGAALRPYVADLAGVVKRTQNRRKPIAPASTPAPKPPVAQGFLAPNLATANTAAADDDLPEDFQKALDVASKDDDE